MIERYLTVGKGNSTEAQEAELRRRLEILKSHFEQGKIKIANHIADQIEESLLAVRYGADGQIDLSTVDSRVRSMALAITAMHDREEMKDSISLREIQEAYFSFIETNFGEYYQSMVDNKLTPHHAGTLASRNKDVVEYTASIIPDFVEILTSFWESSIEPAYAHLEDMDQLKAIFGGDFFPSFKQNIAAKCGLYTDTIVLPDPFLRSGPMFAHWSQERRTYYFIKHALNVLQYKSLALADLSTPIVVVLPERPHLDEDEREFMFNLAEADGLTHANALFGREFESFDELAEFVNPYDTLDKFVEIVSNPSRLLFDTEWKGGIREQIKRAIREYQEDILGVEHVGQLVIT